jgi:hypothetical protein
VRMVAPDARHPLIEHYRIELTPEQAKTGKPDRFDLPAQLTPYIRHHLNGRATGAAERADARHPLDQSPRRALVARMHGAAHQASDSPGDGASSAETPAWSIEAFLPWEGAVGGAWATMEMP